MENKQGYLNGSSSNGLTLGICLAIGLSFCGYFISQTLYNSKVSVNTAEVKGLAERSVEADTVYWTLSYLVNDEASVSLNTIYQSANEHKQAIIDYLVESGFNKQEIEIGAVDYYKLDYRDDDQVLVDQRHNLTGSITLKTHDVKKVAKVRSGLNDLIAKGFNIDNHEPRYLFTQLNKIKPQMLREATENARIAANEFAQIAKVNVGSIRSARQGSFYIRDEGNDYSDDASINKNVRVVTTINFYLTD